MADIAFYAPLKSPDHPVPSGDRELAAGIRAALVANDLGFSVEHVSQLRTYDGQGDPLVQRRLKAEAKHEIERLLHVARDDAWQVWVTYHNYYKAPDLIGPIVSEKLNIPYILIEASISKHRHSGRWADYAALSDLACTRADIILYVTERDHQALALHKPSKQKIIHFPPFLNQQALPVEISSDVDPAARILAVGMLRYGDKFESYRIIANVLPQLTTRHWSLSIVGDGPARPEIESLFKPFGGRVTMRGQLDRPSMLEAYRSATVFLWPGVNEAFGMVYLEAQAAGLPVIAEDRAGVREVIASENSLVPEGKASQLATEIDAVLGSQSLQKNMAAGGREFVQSQHLLGRAATRLSSHISTVLRT